MPCALVGLNKLQHALYIATTLEDKNKQNIFQINTYASCDFAVTCISLLLPSHVPLLMKRCIINSDLLIAFRSYFPHYDQADTMVFIVKQSIIVPIMKYLVM